MVLKRFIFHFGIELVVDIGKIQFLQFRLYLNFVLSLAKDLILRKNLFNKFSIDLLNYFRTLFFSEIKKIQIIHITFFIW